ncbi:MAG: sulfatase-like hydrolase/transferase [Deltaproteobacteria bacterium]|nr:sulfatase-like hydrolase/transferase [Deltaproteobacteria bacterium]
MMWLVSCGLVAGAIGAVAVAILEPFLGISSGPSAIGAAMVVSTGMLLPLGLVVGVGLVAARAMLKEEHRPSQLLRVLVARENPETTGKILAHGMAWLLLLPLFYRAIFHFLTAYRHHGLAALALSLTVTVLVAISALACLRASRLTSSLTTRLGASFPASKRPTVAVAIVCIAWITAIVPPLVSGPDAAGLYGFFGLLRKDGLGAGPLVSVVILAIVAAGLLWPLLAKRRPILPILGVFVLMLGIAGPPLAAWTVSRNQDALELLDSGGGAMSALLKLGRKLSDRDGDGHGTWFGGKDCDDTNREIHPGARDIPDNDVDEDCSFGDLNLAAIKARAKNEEKAPEKKPLKRPALPENVSLLMITVDTLRFDAPGFMGYERDVTPNLDRIAEQGTIYERAYGLGSYTGQAVPPMLTGKYASELIRNDRHEVRISGKETFAAELICGEKVLCAGFLTHFLFNSRYGWSQGFDKWTVVGADPPGPGHIDSKYNSHIVANHAIRWLKKPENTAGQFWLWVHFMDPHKEYLEHKGIKKFGSDRRSRYDHELLFTDHHVGRLLDAFKEIPAAERTVILVSADHGEAFNEHGRWCHGRELWEEIIRVPLAVSGPGVAKKRIARQTSHIDIFPTLLDLFGVPIPEGIHGRSLLPDWVEGQEVEERPIIADQPKNPYYETRRVFIKDGWKLHHLPDTGGYRFHKITDDYERGESEEKTRPDEFAKTKAAYELFSATELKPLEAIRFGGKDLNEMDAP